MRPAKTRISLGIHPVWSVFAIRIKKHLVLSYPLSALRRLWSDWADAQADLSLRWWHKSFCWFCHEVAQMPSLSGWASIAQGGGKIAIIIRFWSNYVSMTFFPSVLEAWDSTPVSNGCETCFNTSLKLEHCSSQAFLEQYFTRTCSSMSRVWVWVANLNRERLTTTLWTYFRQ